MNKRLPTFAGYSEASELLLERSALTMLRGLSRSRREMMCSELLGLCRSLQDPRERSGIRVGAPPPAAAAQEDATVQEAEEWEAEEDGESEWEDDHNWVPPATSTS